MFGMIGGCLGLLMGCTTADLSSLLNTSPTGLSAEVAAKAEQVAQGIGGVSGFGGEMMDGYFNHMDDHMGFHDVTDLAATGGNISVTFMNQSNQTCTFHYAYIRSANGLNSQTRDVDVPAGQSITVDMPCAEIVGLGSLTDVGATAGTAADGTSFDDRFCVPAFLNSDFACEGQFSCSLSPDVNDVNQDGDTQEIIMLTSAMQQHMSSGGMNHHGPNSNGSFGGMMQSFGMMGQTGQGN